MIHKRFHIISIVLILAIVVSCTPNDTASSQQQSAQDSITQLLSMRYNHCFESYEALEYGELTPLKQHPETYYLQQEIDAKLAIKEQVLAPKDSSLNAHDSLVLEQLDLAIEQLQDDLKQQQIGFELMHLYRINEYGFDETVRINVLFDTLLHPTGLILL